MHKRNISELERGGSLGALSPYHHILIFVQNLTQQSPQNWRSWHHLHRTCATGAAAPHNYRARTIITPLEGSSKGKEN